MTDLVKYPSRGMALLQSVASVYVALAGLTSIEVTGRKSTTQDTTTLDGPVTRTKDPDGYADAPTIKASGHFDPAHATYTNLEGIIAAPTATNFKVTYPDDAPTSEIYSVTGVQLDKKGEQGKFMMADITIETSGDPS